MAAIPSRVLIAGGGIGGLCLAQGLRRAGIEVTVFERASSPEEFREGYRLHIDPEGSRALHDCLPPDRFELLRAACGRPPLAFAFLTERLRTLMSVDVVRPGARPDPVAAHRSLNRYTLRQVLLDGIEEHVRFGKELVRYETDGRQVAAYFADGTEASGRVLVGAEGGRSRVRAQLLPHAERIDTGVVSIGGRLPLTSGVRALLPERLGRGPVMVLAPGGINMFLALHEQEEPDDGARLPERMLPPDRGDYLVWALTGWPQALGLAGTSGGERGAVPYRLALEATRGWDDRLQRLVAMTDPATVTTLTIRTAATVKPWPTTNVTVIGDAIHSMPPSRGVGANIALRDASLLARNLAAAWPGRDLLPAIADYERRMRRYGFAAVRASMSTLRMSVTANPLAFALVKAMLRGSHAMLRLTGGFSR